MFEIKLLPTFMFYHDFEIIKKFSGAEELMLIDGIESLAITLGKEPTDYI